MSQGYKFPPSQEQLAIIEASKNRKSILVSALAGTGKTTTIALVLNNLSMQDYPKGAGALAFNKDAATNLAQVVPPWCEARTINAYGHQIVQRALPRRVAIDMRLETTLWNEALESLEGTCKIDKKKLRANKRALGIYNDYCNWLRTFIVSSIFQNGLYLENYKKNFVDTYKPDASRACSLQSFHVLYADALEKQIVQIPQELDEFGYAFPYEAALLFQNLMADSAFNKGTIAFTHQLWMPLVFFRDNFIKKSLIVVDEAQDLSAGQHEFVRLMGIKGHTQVIFVGDRHQAIYGWRGALSNSMDQVLEDYPETIELGLTVTYRCPKAVVSYVQGHVPEYKASEKNIEGNVSQVKCSMQKFVEDIKSLGNKNGAAIICRNNAPLIKLGFELIKDGVMINFLGRDVLANLRKLVITQGDLRNKTQKTSPKSAVEVMRLWYAELVKEKKLANPKADPNKALQWAANYRDCVKVFAAQCARDSFGNTAIEEISIEDVVNAIDAFARKSQDTGVTLASGHKSKGLEFETVFFVYPDLIPSSFATTPEELLQESNLRYVICTRAKKTLVIATISQESDDDEIG